VAEYGTSYLVILPHNTMQKSFVIGFVFISILRILSHTPSQMLCWIVNTSNQRHYSCVLINAFCSGLVKDREAPLSLNYVLLKNYLKLRSYVITRCLLPSSVVKLIFSRNTLTQLKYYGNWIHSPDSHVSFIWMQSLPKTLKPLNCNQMFF